MENIRVSINNTWLADEFPDLFWSDNRWHGVEWRNFDNIFYITIFERQIYYTSKVCNDLGKYLVMKANPSRSMLINSNANIYFDYQEFFRQRKVQDWLAGFNENIFQ